MIEYVVFCTVNKLNKPEKVLCKTCHSIITSEYFNRVNYENIYTTSGVKLICDNSNAIIYNSFYKLNDIIKKYHDIINNPEKYHIRKNETIKIFSYGFNSKICDEITENILKRVDNSENYTIIKL